MPVGWEDAYMKPPPARSGNCSNDSDDFFGSDDSGDCEDSGAMALGTYAASLAVLGAAAILI